MLISFVSYKTYSSSLEHIQCIKHLPETSWVIFLILCWDAYVLLLARSAFLCFLALRISSSFWGRKKFERISDSVLNVNIFTKFLSLNFHRKDIIISGIFQPSKCWLILINQNLNTCTCMYFSSWIWNICHTCTCRCIHVLS